MTYTFFYEEGGFSMAALRGDTSNAKTVDIDAPTLRAANAEFARRFPNSFIIKITYPMNELEQAGFQLGDGWPV